MTENTVIANNAVELRDVVCRFGREYLDDRGGAILPSQRRALEDIAACRTDVMGGRRYRCGGCGQGFWIYHGCRNRACPACHGLRTRQWIEKRETQLLGCNYYHVVATVPARLREVFLADQKRMYSLLMKTVSQCVIEMVQDPRYVGGLPAVMAVLHTWARDLHFHPHVHLLVSGGGLSPDGEQWVTPKHAHWLVPVRALSALIRGRFRANLRRLAPDIESRLPAEVWLKGWNVYCKPCGAHSDAVVRYLGRYVFRTAISNSRIEGIDATHVTFRFRSRKKGKDAGWSHLRLGGEEFLRRFVMHVLPRGFHRVRYYGLWHHSKSQVQKRIALLLRVVSTQDGDPPDGWASRLPPDEPGLPETLADLVAVEGLGPYGSPATNTIKCPYCSSVSIYQIGEARRSRCRNRSP